MSACHIGIAQASTKLNSRLSLLGADWATLGQISYPAMSATVTVSERGLFDGSVDVTLGHFPSRSGTP